MCVWLCPTTPDPSADIRSALAESRALGAILCDVVFRQIAAMASDSTQLVHALIDYMEQGTVLPPSHWDTTTMVEPTVMPDTRQKQLATALREAGMLTGHFLLATYRRIHDRVSRQRRCSLP
jgi:hypothetical protein